MKLFKTRRAKSVALMALFALSTGFSFAQADNRLAEGCNPWPGCDYGGGYIFCCVPE
ncbi:hypothetical protein K4L06_05885 [Lysobacter sp. BMK333-48F3]|uniref:hypothetical protein n=1 Tax=Lysobacter sp. BMK333-48F3 TaxID=2867962 RepID=UPI001C8C846C|nr:hypothetical protein [Lysobacter sp. BMK333-48F3]MBX9400836.1 hypothetical protein [Lysobacter sp. BMK333-48F3]